MRKCGVDIILEPLSSQRGSVVRAVPRPVTQLDAQIPRAGSRPGCARGRTAADEHGRQNLTVWLAVRLAFQLDVQPAAEPLTLQVVTQVAAQLARQRADVKDA